MKPAAPERADAFAPGAPRISASFWLVAEASLLDELGTPEAGLSSPKQQAGGRAFWAQSRGRGAGTALGLEDCKKARRTARGDPTRRGSDLGRDRRMVEFRNYHGDRRLVGWP